MPPDVLANEGGNEVVAVVVPGLQAQFQRLAGGGAGRLQQFGAQLFLQEGVVGTLIDENRQIGGV